MYYKSRKLTSARKRIREQLVELGWQEQRCLYPATDQTGLYRAYETPTVELTTSGMESSLKRINSREEYMALLRRVLRNCFSDGQFRLPDGSTVPAHKFLACLYDIGISQGIATASRQVKAFCALVHEAARGVPDISGFKTAYNTVIEDIRGWKNLLHADKNRKGEVLLHTIEGFEVREDNRADYNQWMRLREKVLQTIA